MLHGVPSSPPYRVRPLAAVLVLVLVVACGCATTTSDAAPTVATAPTSVGVGPSGTATTVVPLTTTTIPFSPVVPAAAPALRPVSPATCSTPIRAASGSGAHTATGDADAGSRRPLGRSQVDPGPEPEPTEPSTTTTTAPPLTPAAVSERFRADPRLAGDTVSASVWIDGLGEVVAVNPDQPLVPASNQKLLTALGAVRLLDPNERLHTEVWVTGPVADGVVHGDIVLVGGGDPTVTRTGAHSLETLVQAVAGAGIHTVTGRVLVDDSRYDDQRSLPSWSADWARWVGPLSSLVLDRNNYAHDAGFLADPALTHAALFEFALEAAGVAVGDRSSGSGESDSSTASAGAAATVPAHTVLTSGMRVATIESPTIDELVAIMLLRSDNLFAELFVKEAGHRASGQPGTTAGGLAAIATVISGLCVSPISGVSVDGSGLSYTNHRSARELRRLLLATELQPWGPAFMADLSVAGQLNAMSGRLTGPRTTGNVRAKGGSLAITRSLSGYLTTASGRHVVFSVIINGPALGQAEPAIDELVTNLASLTG